MEYTCLGNKKISRLTLGTVQLGMKYGVNNTTGKPDISSCMQILKKAVKEGISSFDTSELYGDSEEILGRYISSLPSNSNMPLLITKFTLGNNLDANHKDIERAIGVHIENSLKRLNINKIPVYLLHNPKEMRVYKDLIPKTLLKFQKEGFIDKTGVSVYTSEDILEMLKYDIYEVVQIPINIMDNRLIRSGMLDELHRKNIFVFARSIFLQGLLFMDKNRLPAKLKKASFYLKKLRKMALSNNLSIAELAFSYVKSLKGINSIVIGVETLAQLKENIRLINLPDLNSSICKEIEKTFDNLPMEILDPRLWNI